MEKRITLNEGEYLASDKEKRITPFVLTKYGYELDDRISKSRACPEAVEYALKLDPIPGYRIILVSAMGCLEYWNENKKADAFPINALLGKPPKDVPMSFFDRYRHKIPKEWGITTFPTKFNAQGIQIGGGNTFFEHINRVPPDLMGKPVNYSDPREPRAGYILKAFWNPVLHRVEIVQTVSERKLPRIVIRIDNGELIGVSMACDVGFDRCLKCGNLSTSLNAYCVHLRDKRLRGVIDSDFDLWAMVNDFPFFFDNTLTEKPADQIGSMISKVASSVIEMQQDDSGLWYFGNDYPQNLTKWANYDDTFQTVVEPTGTEKIIRKEANILHSVVNNLKDRLPEYRAAERCLPVNVLHSLRDIPFRNLNIYMTVLMMNPKDEEIAHLMFDLPSQARASGISRFIETNKSNMLNSLSKKASDIPDVEIKISIDDTPPTMEEFRKAASILMPYMEQKSYSPEFVYQRTTKTATAPAADFSAQPFALGRQAQAVLLARVLTEPELLNRLNNFLASPLVRKELTRYGIEFDKAYERIMENILALNLSESKVNKMRRGLYARDC